MSKEAEKPWVKTYCGGKPNYTTPEKQEPVGYLYDWLNPDDRDEVIRDWFAESMCVIEKDKGFNVRPLYAAPVHASDISQERVDETPKCKHEWVGLDGDIPGLGLVTEEFYNGMLCAEDILRKRNTRREWVGLATGEAREFYESNLSREELIHKIDEFLQEKNT